MPNGRQTTLRTATALEGVGLHSGAPCCALLRPADAGEGVVFRLAPRAGETAATVIRAAAPSVVDTRYCTRLGADNGRSIGTVEHLLAACAIAGLDNVAIDIDGGELPILDGSAAPYVDAILDAGLRALSAARSPLKVLRRIEMVDGDRSIVAEPSETAILDVAIEFPDRAIGAQAVTIDLGDEASLRRLARARTFCRLGDIDAMRAAGLSRGGSLDNAIVVDGARILNESQLREPDEFALHKALDLLGDLRLAGRPILARISATRPGHDLNVRFLRKLLETPVAVEATPAVAASLPAAE